MAKQVIGIGTTPNDGTGDTIRGGGDKINDNFNEIYTLLGTGTALTSGLSATSSVVTLVGPTITGVASFADGSNSAPSITNTSDTNTGIYFSAADEVAITTAGIQRVRFTNSDATFSTAITSSGSITGGGLLTTGGNIVIPDAGTIGSATTTGAMTIAANGNVTFSGTVAAVGTVDFEIKNSAGTTLKTVKSFA